MYNVNVLYGYGCHLANDQKGQSYKANCEKGQSLYENTNTSLGDGGHLFDFDGCGLVHQAAKITTIEPKAKLMPGRSVYAIFTKSAYHHQSVNDGSIGAIHQ